MASRRPEWGVAGHPSIPVFMNTRLRLALVSCLSAVVWGCDAGGELGGLTGSERTHLTVSDVVQFDGYTVEYLQGSDPSTFTYRVTGSGDEANLNYVFIETVCPEAPVDVTPSNATAFQTNTDADTTVTGVQWNQGLGEGGSRDYSMTFATPQEVGAVLVIIRAGSTVHSALIEGACGNLFDLGGSVFVNDGDDDGSVREGTELGIQDVRVDIYDAGGGLATSVQTQGDGRFSARLLRGDYEVVIPEAAPGSFNETLSVSYDPAGATRRAVSLSADVSDVDFGFDPDREVILSQLSEGGTYVTNGEEVKVWKRWINRAERGQSFSDDGLSTTPDQVAAWLDQIFASPGETSEGYFGNAQPYELAEGEDPFAAARTILSTRLNNRSTEAEVLYVEVFAMQLNFLSGRGSQDPLYDETLIELFETLGSNSAAARVGQESGISPATPRSAAVSLDQEIARAFNGGGGGEGGDN